MCWKTECPHRGEKMCSCEAMQTKDSITQITHLLGNIQEPKAELSYTSLAAPHPYRLCLSGVCGKCGRRLCVSLEENGDFSGDDFLAAVYRHLYQVFIANFGMRTKDFQQMFTELFHEQDRFYIQHWLELLENQCMTQMYHRTGNSFPEQDSKTTIYTIVQTAADADHGDFPTPFACGSYRSIDRARERLRELIAEEKKQLNERMDTEELLEDSWEMYEDGSAAVCFVRIEILSSELEGGPHNA